MSNVTDAPATAAHTVSPGDVDSLSGQLTMLVRALRASPERLRLVLLCGGLILVIGAPALAQVRLNAWN